MGPLKMLPLGMQQLDATALSSAVGLTVPAGANMVIISVAVASTSVAFTDNGVDPASTLGIQVANGNPPFEYWGNVSALKFIKVAGSPVLNVAYYKIAG